MFLNHKNKNNKINVHYLFIQCNLTISRLVKAKQLSIKQFYCIVFMINQRNDKIFCSKGDCNPFSSTPPLDLPLLNINTMYTIFVCFLDSSRGQIDLLKVF